MTEIERDIIDSVVRAGPLKVTAYPVRMDEFPAGYDGGFRMMEVGDAEYHIIHAICGGEGDDEWMYFWFMPTGLPPARGSPWWNIR